jgi:hypothetical protein
MGLGRWLDAARRTESVRLKELQKGRWSALLPPSEVKTVALEAPGTYHPPLGGGLPLPGQPPVEPPFLAPGAFTLTGSGRTSENGVVGPFSASFDLASTLTWDNFGGFDSISRSEPLTLQWTGGDPSTLVVLIAGASMDNEA